MKKQNKKLVYLRTFFIIDDKCCENMAKKIWEYYFLKMYKQPSSNSRNPRKMGAVIWNRHIQLTFGGATSSEWLSEMNYKAFQSVIRNPKESLKIYFKTKSKNLKLNKLIQSHSSLFFDEAFARVLFVFGFITCFAVGRGWVRWTV